MKHPPPFIRVTMINMIQGFGYNSMFQKKLEINPMKRKCGSCFREGHVVSPKCRGKGEFFRGILFFTDHFNNTFTVHPIR